MDYQAANLVVVTFQTLFTYAAASAVLQALNTWKSQLRGERTHSQATKVLGALAEFEDTYRGSIYLGNTISPSDSNLAIFESSFNRFREAYLQPYYDWGEDYQKHVSNVRTVFNCMKYAYIAAIINQRDKGQENTELELVSIDRFFNVPLRDWEALEGHGVEKSYSAFTALRCFLQQKQQLE